MKSIIRTIFYSIFLLCFFHAPVFASGSATLFVTTPSSTVQEGSRVTVDVNVGSTDQSINAVSGVLSFPSDLLRIVSITRDNSILNIWTHDPDIGSSKVSFEGVILNPGFQGAKGVIVRITFEAKKSGIATISFNEGSVLANDGQGTNVLGNLKSTRLAISGRGVLDLIDNTVAAIPGRLPALPVITDYSPAINSLDALYVKGKGEPNALTQIAFENVSHKSFGEQFMDFVQSKKKRLTSVLLKNNDKGMFEYVSPKNLLAGVYNATPFLVDAETNSSKPGLGIQLLVSDSRIIKNLIVFINILILLIPIVGLIVVIYFIPWYSSRRMRILKRKMGLEEEKILLTEHELERKDRIMDMVPRSAVDAEKIT